jgi:hypothetical protein
MRLTLRELLNSFSFVSIMFVRSTKCVWHNVNYWTRLASCQLWSNAFKICLKYEMRLTLRELLNSSSFVSIMFVWSTKCVWHNVNYWTRLNDLLFSFIFHLIFHITFIWSCTSFSFDFSHHLHFVFHFNSNQTWYVYLKLFWKMNANKLFKIIKKTRKVVKNSMNAKMTTIDINTHFKHYKNEFKIAIYLEYTDVMKFKKFRFSVIILKWYLCYHKYCQAKNIKISFALLKDLSDLSSAFFKFIKDLLNYYFIVESKIRDNRKDNIQNRNYIYVDILYNLANLINQARAFYVFDSTVHKNISNRFEKAFDKIIDFKISTFDSNKIQFSILDSRSEFEKHVLKKYNRVNAVIKFLQIVLTSTKWRETFNIKFSFKFIKIVANIISIWMKSFDTKDVQVVIITFNEFNARSKKKFFLTLNMKTRIKTNLKLKKHIKNHVKYNSLRMSKIMIKTDRDSRNYSFDEMWRNIIRR